MFGRYLPRLHTLESDFLHGLIGFPVSFHFTGYITPAAHLTLIDHVRDCVVDFDAVLE
jgi:hypothetical protein